MAARIAVSLEEKGVRVLYASAGPRSIRIQKSLLLNEGEFDRFLKKEGSRSFIVSADFKNIFHDLIQIPPVAEKFIKSLVSNELKKRAPELGKFLFRYETVGEKFVEGKKVKEIFAVAVSEEEVNGIVSHFASRGKIVDALYPNISCISALASASMNNNDDAALFVSESGFAKTLFVVNRGRLVFVRTASSTGSGIRDFDVQNVNMTISYCRQTLKLNPSVVMLAGSACQEYEASSETIVPSACMMLPHDVFGRQDVILDNIFPVSALLCRKKLKLSNMLTVPYRTEQMLNKFFKAGAACFALLIVIGFLCLRESSDRIRMQEQKVANLSAQIAAVEPVAAEIRNLRTRLEPMLPAINALNSSSSEPSINKALASAGGFASRGVSLDSLLFRVDSDAVLMTAKGAIKSGSYLQTQSLFIELLNALTTNGLEIRSKSLDLKDNMITVEAVQKAAQ
ncbi:MAG: hypothetical protein RBT37_01000 [Dissulfurispiraceae bacterium]|nr:hypothetical protein [Dissulfurispiraceae bacterium]